MVCWVFLQYVFVGIFDAVMCREKDEVANAKLQQMVSGQNEAERRKGEAETLSKDLEQQNRRIAERRHQVCSDTW